MITERLKKQIEFLLEADKMKSLYRQTYIIHDEKRCDSMRDAEDDGYHKRREMMRSIPFIWRFLQ